MVIGSELAFGAGATLFGFLKTALLRYLPEIAVAAAVLAVGVACARALFARADEERAAAVARIGRILLVVAFLSCLGAVFSWVVSGTSAEGAPGLEALFRWGL